MKLAFGLALTLALLSPLAGCSDETAAAAKNTIREAAKSTATAASAVVQGVEGLDIASLSPQELLGKVGWVFAWCADQFEAVQDTETAKEVAAAIEQVLDAAEGLLEGVATESTNRDEVRGRIKDLRARFASNSSVLHALDPALRRLSSLLD